MARRLAATVALALAACTPQAAPPEQAAPEPHHAPIPEAASPIALDWQALATIPAPRPVVRRASRNAVRTRPRTPNSPTVRTAGDGDVWTALAECESGNTNDHGAPFFGFFQFSSATFHSLGYSGNADDYPYDVQLEAAQRLKARSGAGQWPVCGRKVGL